jgi:hypothetical protein
MFPFGNKFSEICFHCYQKYEKYYAAAVSNTTNICYHRGHNPVFFKDFLQVPKIGHLFFFQKCPKNKTSPTLFSVFSDGQKGTWLVNTNICF